MDQKYLNQDQKSLEKLIDQGKLPASTTLDDFYFLINQAIKEAER